MDFSDYQPAPHVLERLKGVDFVAVVGPTAAGKTTAMRVSAEQDSRVAMVLTTTSRAVRPGERDGVDLHFKTREEMTARMARGEYVQVAPSLLGDIYATAPEDYPVEGVAALAVFAEALEKFRTLPFRSFTTIFVTPPDWQTWQARIKSHGFAPDQLAKRLGEAKRSLSYSLQDPTVQFVISSNESQTAMDFITIATNQPLNPREQQDQARARQIINELLTKL